MSEQKQPWWLHLLRIPAKIGEAIRHFGQWYNHTMRTYYSPRSGAFVCTVIVLLMCIITLFIPPVTGVADDGSLDALMKDTGLEYRQQDLEAPIGAYFIRTMVRTGKTGSGLSSQYLLIGIARWIDDIFTCDHLFDLRYLAAVYLILYLPAVFLAAEGLLLRVRQPMEGTFIAVLCGIIFGDAGTVSYFNSLYPEALWVIGVLYVMGFMLLLEQDRRFSLVLSLVGITAAGSMLIMMESHLAVIGPVLTVFVLRMMFRNGELHPASGLVIMSAAVLLCASFGSGYAALNRFSETSRLHALTNGVLLRAENPAKALAEFGIDDRYETLTETYSYADYPYVLSGQREIQEDVLSNCETGSIVLYYVRHPLEAYGLLEIGTRAALNSPRSYVGNYEASLGLPERARNPLLILYSNFRSGVVPKTTGFLLLLSIVYLALFRPTRNPLKKQKWTLRDRQNRLSTFFCLLLMGITDMFAVICLSGTAEIERYQMFYGCCTDCMLILVLTEVLHRAKIISGEEES